MVPVRGTWKSARRPYAMPPMPDPGHWRSCYSPGGTAARGRRQSCGGGASFRMRPFAKRMRTPACDGQVCLRGCGRDARSRLGKQTRPRTPAADASLGRPRPCPVLRRQACTPTWAAASPSGSSRPWRRPCPLSACTCRWRCTFLPDRLDRAEIRGAGRPVKPNVTSKAAFFCRIGGRTD